jgi:superfamily II DNA helicase RecQ
MRLGVLRAILPNAKFVALTATATAAAQKEIAEVLLMRDPVIVRQSPDR